MTPKPDPSDGPTRPSAPTGRTALRERLREALIATALRQAREKGIKLSTFTTATIRANAEALADAVMPVIEGLPNRGYCEHCGRGDCAPTAEQYHQQTQRAEEAERERDQARAAIADERRGRLAVEAAVRRVRALAEAAKRESVASFARRITGEPFPARLLADDVIAALDAEEPR